MSIPVLRFSACTSLRLRENADWKLGRTTICRSLRMQDPTCPPEKENAIREALKYFAVFSYYVHNAHKQEALSVTRSIPRLYVRIKTRSASLCEKLPSHLIFRNLSVAKYSDASRFAGSCRVSSCSIRSTIRLFFGVPNALLPAGTVIAVFPRRLIPFLSPFLFYRKMPVLG